MVECRQFAKKRPARKKRGFGPKCSFAIPSIPKQLNKRCIMTSNVVSSQRTTPAMSGYITPQEQLEELTQPFIEPIVCIIKKTFLFRDLESIIAYYAIDPIVTNWYTALDSQGILPSYVPRLPKNMVEILTGKCPVFSDKKKSYSVIQTSVFYLLPEQSGGVHQNVERIEALASKKRIGDAG